MLLLQCAKPTSNFGNESDESELLNDSVFNDLFLEQVESFEKSLDYLREQILLGNDGISKVAFNKAFIEFKSFGFLLEYFDHSLYELFNGAPVYKEDESSPGANVIEPMGLQVIYELILDPTKNKIDLLYQINFLNRQLDYVKAIVHLIGFNNQDVLNAIEKWSIRFETLTLAGFDNPDFRNEYLFLSKELDGLNFYLNYTNEAQLQIKYDSTLVFDKLHFLKHDLYPFKQSLSLFVDSVVGVSPIKNLASNIYDQDFLNPSFYSANGIQNIKDDSKIELGKMLFNDPILSRETVNFSCATCHQPDKYFTDGLTVSASNQTGITLARNTPTLIHAAYQSKYMYDGRAESLEEQMLHVFKNKKEFQTNMLEVISKLENHKLYSELFQTNYPELTTNAITLYSITDALANYVRSLDGSQSTFDKYMRGEVETISPNVAQGFNLFIGKAKCGTCHFAPTFSGLIPPLFRDLEFENIGIPKLLENNIWTEDEDLGRYNFYPTNAFKHFFKTSTIRNVEHTAPYMHNGVFITLEEVMGFYNEGGGVPQGLKYHNQTLPEEKLELTPQEIKDVIAFMKSLSDERYINY